jgi:radical SAM protein with 4Fe4S-binding SPASM domain
MNVYWEMTQACALACRHCRAEAMPHAHPHQLTHEEGLSGEEIRRTPIGRGFGVRDGNGIMFVSNTGEICPAGFLPVSAGNVKRDDIVAIYRESPLFASLHDPKQFKGRCGRCEFKMVCGGSRARAFVASGDPLGEDPLCPYEPAALN